MKSTKNPIKILIITQLKKKQSIQLTKSAIDQLHNTTSLNIQLFSEDPKTLQHTYQYNKNKTQINYVISIGQNGTMMHAFRILSNYNSVPVISISDGDQPIISSYSFCQLENVLNKFIKAIQQDNVNITSVLQFDYFQRNNMNNKSSFSCQLEIHRDMKKSVLRLKIYAKIQDKDYIHLANLWGDGVIISTPLGSMGRNINLSGPILYKSLDSITIVPISPLSLKFRPIILPATAQILIEVQQSSRSPAQIFADGQMICDNLVAGKQILLKKSDQPSKLVKGLSEKSTDQHWVSCLREVLTWGEVFHDNETKETANYSKL